ncbi:MAG: AAA family ATPase [Mollicutes bacterium]|nr:AAA family ATPase [Mollicutes bacterium]MDY6071138.1 AAA family ATPase [Bacilli bacterium]
MPMRVFERKIYQKMLQWKKESEGKTALLIKGARRVGKSTIAEEFAKKEYSSYILIDFSVATKEIHELFEDLSDLNYLFLRLQLIYHVNLEKRKSVIIFDEVQKEPLARQAIKHLVKDGRYDYIETGSLLSIKRNVKDILIPSEETRIEMTPMDYEEFRWALGDKATIPMLRSAFDNKISLGDDVNRRLLRDFRLYMLVGGMPQAVNEYLDTNNLSKVDRVKRSILELYQDDFRKIDPTGRASLLFSAIPSELTKNASRYQVSSVLPNTKPDRILGIVGDMKDSLTVNIAYHANDPSAGLSMHEDISRYKMFIMDTGLFVTLAFMDRDFTENIIYEKLLSDKLDADLGYLYENMVAQMLYSNGNRLFYYTFPKEKSTHNYEIDFLLARGNKVCPIEVKSSGYKTHASMDAFSGKFSGKIGQKYLIYTKDLRKDGDILCLPIYMTMFL